MVNEPVIQVGWRAKGVVIWDTLWEHGRVDPHWYEIGPNSLYV